MNILEILKTKDNTSRKELLETGISDYEIKKLIAMEVLTKQARASYKINTKMVQKLLLQEFLENSEEITRKQLIDLGLTDYEIRKMLKEGKLFTLSRGMFATKKTIDDKEKNLSTQEIQKVIASRDIAKMVEIIDQISNEDFIPLSKELLKLLVNEIFATEKLVSKKIEEEKEDVKKIQEEPSLAEFVEMPEEEIITNIEENNSEVELSIVKNEQQETLLLDELWNLYTKNFKDDPILAKEYLEKYKKLCKEENVYFNYYEYIKINDRIANMNISKEQEYMEKNLAKEIRELLSLPFDQYNNQRLKELIDQFCQSYQDRGFYGKYFKGCYEKKCRHYNQAMDVFNEILRDEPENIIVLRSVCALYYEQRKFKKCEKMVNYTLKYEPERLQNYILLAGCYIFTNRISKIINLTDRIMKLEDIDIEFYLKTVVSLLLNKLYKNNEKMYYCPKLTKTIVSEMKLIDELIQEYKEMLSQIASNNPNITDSILKEYDFECYDDEIYYYLSSQNNTQINISNIKTYIDNLDITSDERMLLYLSAAKVLFINKLPKQAEVYMKLVEKEKDKSSSIKENYARCRKNKMLYLNK